MTIGEINREVRCGDCGSAMRLRKGMLGLFYGCSRYPACKGTHKSRLDGSPIGEPASAQLKVLREETRKAFERDLKCQPVGGDSIALSKARKREQLARLLKRPEECIKWSELTTEECERVLAWLIG